MGRLRIIMVRCGNGAAFRAKQRHDEGLPVVGPEVWNESEPVTLGVLVQEGRALNEGRHVIVGELRRRQGSPPQAGGGGRVVLVGPAQGSPAFLGNVPAYEAERQPGP